MLLEGYYYNEKGRKISLEIVTLGDKSEKVEIGGAKVKFGTGIEIEHQVDSTFDHLLCQQATVNLHCKNYMESLFNWSCRDASVWISVDDKIVFAGFVEPLTFSQGYNEDWDEVSLTCVDALTALGYQNYREIGSSGVSYDSIKSAAVQRSFHDIMKEARNSVKGLWSGKSGGRYWYDGSKSPDSADTNKYSIFANTSISELLFLGDTEDDVWSESEVLEEILKYLNLHILQDGLDFYIFSWETLRNGGSVEWRDMATGEKQTTTAQTIKIASGIVADTNCQLSVGEIYNQIALTDSVTETDTIVESPLDDDSLTNGYDGMQKYMTEYISEGEGKNAIGAFGGMVTGSGTTWEDSSKVDWYVQLKKATDWKMYAGEGTSRGDIAEKMDGTYQENVANLLGTGIGNACVVSFGSVEKKNGGSDNSPVTSVDLKDYLAISVNGINDSDKILAACPCCEYTGGSAGGTFSPSDSESTNYIVISGKIVLNPLMELTDSYTTLKGYTVWNSSSRYWHKTVPSRNNGDGRYYTQEWWSAETWKSVPKEIETTVQRFNPYTGSGPREMQYEYNSGGSTVDMVDKVPLIQCMLIIGGKCVVEKQKDETLGTDTPGTGKGEPGDFVWLTYKPREECEDDEEYYAQSFTVGIDPKPEDYIIGDEFDIQKNASYTLGISASGTAIPIKASDKVSGKVRFMILGPVNSTWNAVSKHTHHDWLFWKHTTWSEEQQSILAKTASIMMRDFKVEVVSDNGLATTRDDSDIVYMSAAEESYVNKKDDIEFKITTALTTEECTALGVNQSVKLSSPYNESAGTALLSIYDRNTKETAKPEQIYVDAYWQEYNWPKVELEQTFEDTSKNNITALDLYSHPLLGKTFYAVGIDRDLSAGTATVTMKEV